MPNSKSSENIVFYLKMKADYNKILFDILDECEE